MANAKKITELLLKKYPDPKIALYFSSPLELLVATILSAQCTDVRVNEVTKKLFKKYRTLKDYADADIKTFEEEIKPTGFFRNKAKSIINCCKMILKEFNGIVPSTLKDLIKMPGIGRKTANVILGGAFGKQTIAVDTHVLRLSNRLGLAHSDNPDKVEETLNKQVPKDKWTKFNLALILHGRETCAARKPKCGRCVLFNECGWNLKSEYLKKGYKLIKSPDLSEDEITANVKGNFWKKIIFLKSVDSTNEFAAKLSIGHEIKTAIVVIADSQEKGRGRLGREWISPSGVNIYMSIILKPEIEPKDATLLTVLTAVACAVALRKVSGLKITIKWPNDLMVSGKKIGGILTEVRSEPDRIKIAVIGIGINVNIESKDFPEKIQSIAASVKDETGKDYSRSEIIIQILREFEDLYKTFIKKGRSSLLKKWKELSSTLGKKVTIEVGKEIISGIAEDIDDEGMLILRTQSGGRRKISSGDVTILK